MTPFDISFRMHSETHDTVLTAESDFRFDIHRIEAFFSKSMMSPMIDLLRIVHKEWQRRLFPLTSESRLCLYSGGLDSAAGLGTQLLTDAGRPTIPITVWHQSVQRRFVRQQMGLIRDRFAESDLNPLIFKAHLLHHASKKRREEPTQRSRAFLFMAAGAASASMCGSAEIEIYESGIGSINLPLLAGMTGSRTTRSTHPEFLRLMSGLVSTIGSREINFTLPFSNMTKGDLVTELAKNDLGKLAKATVSCVHFPLREKLGKQCGVCPACLFRRQAMLTAGIDEAVDAYRFDLFTGDRELLESTDRHLRFLKAYLMQVRELQDIRPGKPLPDRVLQHLVGTNIIKQSDATAPYIELLSRYRDQWMQVVREAESNGYSWTNMTGPSGPSKEGVSHASA